VPLAGPGRSRYPGPGLAEGRAQEAAASISQGSYPQRELLHLLRWYVSVRWAFVASLGAAIVTSAFLVRGDLPHEDAAATGVVILLYNVAFLVRHRRLRGRPDPDLQASRREAALQVALDLLALTVLVHLAGGAETPFIGFYLFHAIVGSMLLTRRAAWLAAMGAFALFVSVAALEYAGILEHRHALWSDGESLHRDLRFLALTSVAFLVTLCATISITSSIVGTLRTRERQLLDAHDELLVEARDLEQAYSTLAERQRQLVQTEKQASLGQLVAGIAHEINNPIQFIYGNMGILSEAFSDVLPVIDSHAAARPDLRIARLDYPFFRSHLPVLLTDMGNGAARIAALVRDLKTFARRDEGTLDETVDVNDAVRASLRLLHNQLRHLQIQEQLEQALPTLRGSVTQIEQVVVNTLQNAADAIGEDARGVIRIRTCTEPDGTRIRLSIEDNGGGMAPEVKERIFDPFFTTKQRTGGTGLGLAITYGIIQQHRGEILVESRLGEGTVFHYLLPIDRNGAAA
jgi:signal transduction histidine kinase